MDYQHQTGKFESHDGLQLYYQMWSPPDARPDRTLVIQHGLGEHSGRYQNVLAAFQHSGINIVAMDARGHGRSAGTRGDAPAMVDFLIDLEDFFILLRDRYRVHKPILLGHSMGGLIAINFCLRYSNQWTLRALVTSGAVIRPHLGLEQKIKKGVGQLIGLVSPALILPTGLSPDGLSHDPQVARWYSSDPLTHDRISIRMALDLIEAGHSALKNAPLLKIPALITHGQADPIADANASVEFFQRISSSEKEIKIYPDLYHEIYNETPADRQQVLADLQDFVINQFPPDTQKVDPPKKVTQLEAGIAGNSS